MKGDKGDFNTHFLYNGANKYIEPMVGTGVNVILNDYVPGWSADTAKEMVKKAVIANDMKLDAVLCPNDGLAGGAAAAVQELGLKIMLSLLVWMQNWRRLKDLLQERRMQQCIWT